MKHSPKHCAEGDTPGVKHSPKRCAEDDKREYAVAEESVPYLSLDETEIQPFLFYSTYCSLDCVALSK